MKAILVEPDQSLRWGDVPDPQLKPGEALIKVYAAGVNRADLMQRSGDYPPPPGSPEWMGLEISGTIEALGGGEAAQNCPFSVGDRVCALVSGGGYAQYISVPCDMLLPIPKGLTMEEAAALPEAFFTAYLNLFVEGGLKPGNTLLMHAGGSGLASAVIPMAKAFGARVITTVRTEEKAEKIAHLHADRVVVTSRESIVEVMKAELAAKRPVDIAIDCVGGAQMGECLPYMQRWGRWIIIAALAGSQAQIDLKNLYVRNIRLIGSTLRTRTPAFKAMLRASLERDIWPKLDSGELRPTLWRALPICQAEEAHALLQSGTSVGKVVLVLP